uniref:M23 family metallopeptidase n=1 Tax=Cyanothece sp. BG0011 TaxID=2082950 RepID=UPI0030DA2D41
MQQFKSIRRKLQGVRSSCRWLVSLGIVALMVPVSVNGWRQFPSQAQYVPATNSTNTWQYASFPVENFQTYTSGYGYRTSPITGQSQFHRGLDMAAPLGSYVRNWWGDGWLPFPIIPPAEP